MDADQIIDRDSLEAWLQGRSRADAVVIATRAALRVLPIYAGWVRQDRVRKGDLTALEILRCLLTSGVAAVSPTAEVMAAARSATAAAARSAAAALTAAFRSAAAFSAFSATTTTAAATAARSAASAASARSAAAAARAAATAAFSAADATTTAAARSQTWVLIRDDAGMLERGQDPVAARLWSATEPDWFAAADAKTRAIWQADPTLWSFWTRWWDGVLSGQQIDWALQEQVALIPDAVWRAGPGAVAEAIRGIEAQHLRTQDLANELDNQHDQGQSPNTRVVQLQIGVLRSLIDEETFRLRGRNVQTEDQRVRLASLLAILARILELVIEMETALQDQHLPPSTALVVVQDKLPLVVQEAEHLVEQGGEPKVSAAIISMAATTKLLTESGAPGSLALAVAFCDTAWTTVAKWFKKPKTVESPLVPPLPKPSDSPRFINAPPHPAIPTPDLHPKKMQ